LPVSKAATIAQKKRWRATGTARRNYVAAAALLADGYSHAATARMLKLSETWVKRQFPMGTSKELRGVTPLRVEVSDDDEMPRYVPPPEKIRAMCRQIQKEWSPRERYKRSDPSRRLVIWLPPVVPVPENFD
jgi:hypothetical protein